MNSIDLIRQAFPEAEGPHDLYQNAYDASECGVSVGLLLEFDGQENWYYCDELAGLDEKWVGLSGDADQVLALSVSSIVEGVDEGVPATVIWLHACAADPELLRQQFDEAVKDTEQAAAAIWNSTHGCPYCAYLNHGRPHDWYWPQIDADLPDQRYEHGGTPVNSNCMKCNGQGIVI